MCAEIMVHCADGNYLFDFATKPCNTHIIEGIVFNPTPHIMHITVNFILHFET